MIYFIQDEAVYLIKIGYTANDASDRLAALQTGSPVGLHLLLTIPGDQEFERILHARFAALRERGEWFRPGPELIRYVAEQATALAPRGRPWAAGVIDAVRASGFHIRSSDGKLLVNPVNALPGYLSSLLRSHRAEIIEILNSPGAGGSSASTPPPPAVACDNCGPAPGRWAIPQQPFGIVLCSICGQPSSPLREEP